MKEPSQYSQISGGMNISQVIGEEEEDGPNECRGASGLRREEIKVDDWPKRLILKLRTLQERRRVK